MQHIAFICANDSSPWGGSELLWSQTAERLVRSGVKVSIGARDWGQKVKQIDRLKELGCRVLLRREERLGKRILRKLLPLQPKDLSFVEALASPRPDLVVISQGNSNDGLRWMEALRALRLHYVTITQAAAVEFWAADDVAIQLAEHFELAQANYFVSRSNLELCRRQFATGLTRAKVVRNPFGVSYDANPEWPGNPAKHLSLACVGRLDLVAKGQDMLIDVLSLRAWRTRDVAVTLYGSGVNRRCIEHQIRQCGLANVIFGGFTDNVERVWAAHHALVLPSRFEGLPLAIVEAMLCGRPCIATDVAGNGEVIRHGMNGFLAQAPTTDLLGAAMEEAWARRDDLESMGQAAAADIRKLIPRDPIGAFISELELACG